MVALIPICIQTWERPHTRKTLYALSRRREQTRYLTKSHVKSLLSGLSEICKKFFRERFFKYQIFKRLAQIETSKKEVERGGGEEIGDEKS